ncbi:MAG TPA: hypothetical protein VF473_00895 [Cyclobacteriaceae bacterium]
MTHSLTITLSAFEDAFLSWAWNNSPTLVTIAALIGCTWWIRGQFSDYRSRFIKVELDCKELVKKTDQLDVRVGRLEKRMKFFGRRLTNIEKKLDCLIIHLKDQTPSKPY